MCSLHGRVILCLKVGRIGQYALTTVKLTAGIRSHFNLFIGISVCGLSKLPDTVYQRFMTGYSWRLA